MRSTHAREPDLVLIVDDERSIALVVQMAVVDDGYKVVLARNGQEALDILRMRHPALVITDLMMPSMNGKALIEALRAEAAASGHAAPPVILMTASGEEAIRDSGADAILLKPFELDDVSALLHRFLAAADDQ